MKGADCPFWEFGSWEGCAERNEKTLVEQESVILIGLTMSPEETLGGRRRGVCRKSLSSREGGWEKEPRSLW